MAQAPIILLTADALRADHLCYQGYDRDTSPFLDGFSSNEYCFNSAISTSSHTREAAPSILSGEYPDVFASNNYHYVPHTIADRLSRVGYETGGFHSNPYISRAYGFDSGFQRFDDDLTLGRNKLIALAQRALHKFVFNRGNYHARAEEINMRSLLWIDSIVDEKPFFLWNHYMDTHGPYNPPENYSYASNGLSNSEAQELYDRATGSPETLTGDQKQLLIDAYDGEIRYLDRQLESFFSSLRDRGLVEDSLIIFTSDHGDAFGEYGYYGHPRYLHEPLIHIPLIISPPGDSLSPSIKRPVSTIDIVPTILGHINQSSRNLPGESLIATEDQNGRLDDAIVFSMATGEEDNEKIRRFAARGPDLKAMMERDIESGEINSEYVFDLNRGEEETLRSRSAESPGQSKILEKLREFSRNRLDKEGRTVADSETVDDRQVEERLKALGYK